MTFDDTLGPFVRPSLFLFRVCGGEEAATSADELPRLQLIGTMLACFLVRDLPRTSRSSPGRADPSSVGARSKERRSTRVRRDESEPWDRLHADSNLCAHAEIMFFANCHKTREPWGCASSPLVLPLELYADPLSLRADIVLVRAPSCAIPQVQELNSHAHVRRSSASRSATCSTRRLQSTCALLSPPSPPLAAQLIFRPHADDLGLVGRELRQPGHPRALSLGASSSPLRLVLRLHEPVTGLPTAAH